MYSIALYCIVLYCRLHGVKMPWLVADITASKFSKDYGEQQQDWLGSTHLLWYGACRAHDWGGVGWWPSSWLGWWGVVQSYARLVAWCARPTSVNFQPLIGNLSWLQETPDKKVSSLDFSSENLEVWWEIGRNKKGQFSTDFAIFSAFITSFDNRQSARWIFGEVCQERWWEMVTILRYVRTGGARPEVCQDRWWPSSIAWAVSVSDAPARPQSEGEKLPTLGIRLSTVGLQSFLCHLTCDLGEEVSSDRPVGSGYRESAAFLLRSADELENLLQIQPKL